MQRMTQHAAVCHRRGAWPLPPAWCSTCWRTRALPTKEADKNVAAWRGDDKGHWEPRSARQATRRPEEITASRAMLQARPGQRLVCGVKWNTKEAGSGPLCKFLYPQSLNAVGHRNCITGTPCAGRNHAARRNARADNLLLLTSETRPMPCPHSCPQPIHKPFAARRPGVNNNSGQCRDGCTRLPPHRTVERRRAPASDGMDRAEGRACQVTRSPPASVHASQ
jgi:hypothetical protein